MSYKTKEELIQDVIKLIGEVEGTSVQTYSEPRVSIALDHIFEVAFRKFWWPQYMRWIEATLDGTLGIVTTDLTAILKDIRDLRCIIPADQERALPLLPLFSNPFNMTGTKPRFFEALGVNDANFVSRTFRVWPMTAEGDVKLHVRTFPTIIDTTTLYLDDKLLTNGASWLILDAEDVNPNAAHNCERMFNEIFANIMKSYSELPLENTVGNYGSYLTDWHDH